MIWLKIFDKYIDVFQNNTVSIIKEYDTVLKSLYGDYMKLHPENKLVMCN